MKITDNHAKPIPINITNTAAKGANNLKVSVQSINPLKATGVVMMIGGGITGFVNFKRYKKGKISKKQAITATTSDTVGMGLAFGLGFLVEEMLAPFILVTAASPLLPFAIGVAVTMATKITWDSKTKNNRV